MDISRIVRKVEKQVGGTSFLGSLPKDKFKVLIATILSARTRDVNTDKVVKNLFKKYPTAKTMSHAKLSDIRRLVKSSGYYNQKAKYVLETAKRVAREGMPKTTESLMRLPGVGRKVAGCVMVYGYGKAEGIPTDTHVFRCVNRIGIVKEKTPEKTEQALMKVVPKRLWIKFNEIFVLFGQQICKPHRPLCYKCAIVKECKYPNKNLKNIE